MYGSTEIMKPWLLLYGYSSLLFLYVFMAWIFLVPYYSTILVPSTNVCRNVTCYWKQPVLLIIVPCVDKC